MVSIAFIVYQVWDLFLKSTRVFLGAKFIEPIKYREQVLG